MGMLYSYYNNNAIIKLIKPLDTCNSTICYKSKVCICILSPQSYFKGTEGAKVNCDMSGWQLSRLFTNPLVLHMPLCLVLVSNLHDMG